LEQEAQSKNQHQEKIRPLPSGKSAIDTFGLATFVIVVILFGGMFLFNLFQDKKIATAQKNIQAYQTKLASKDYDDLNTKVEAVLTGDKILSNVLSSKKRWSQFYVKLNQITPKNVKIDALSVDDKGTVKLDGQTTNLTTLAQAIVAFQKGSDQAPTPLQAVTLASHSYAQDGPNRVVKFTLTATANAGATEVGK